MADGKVVIDVILDDGTVAKGVTNIDKRMGGLGGTAKRAAMGIGQIATALGVVGLASKAIDMVTRSIDGAISRYDTLNNFPSVMQQIGFSAGQSQEAINRLSDGIQGLPTRLDDVAETAQRIAVMTKDLDGAVETTLALNNAFIASGSDSAAASRGLEQYVQMLAKGEVDLQSWRTLQETMGVALNDVAEAFGYAGASAQNDLYDALKEGHITFDQFNDKIIELSNETNGFAERALTASGGIRTAWTNMGTAVVRGVTNIIEAIDSVLADTSLGSIENIIAGIGTAFFNVLNGIAQGIPVIIGAFQSLSALVAPIIEGLVSFIMELWGGLLAWWQDHGQMIADAAQNMMDVIWAIMQALWPVIQFLIVETWNSIQGVIEGAIGLITGLIQAFSALFTGDWSALWEAVKQIVSSGVELVWNLINLYFIGRILKTVKTFSSRLTKNVKGLWKNVTDLFKNGVKQVQNFIDRGFKAINSVIASIMNAIRSFLSSVWNGISNSISSVTNGIRNTISSIFNSLQGIVSSAFSGVRNAVSNGMNAAYNAVTNMLSRFRDAGRRIVTSIADGIRNAVGSVTSAISSVTSRVRDFLPFSPAKVGPLRDLNKLDFEGPIEDSIKLALPNIQGLMANMLQIPPLASDVPGSGGAGSNQNVTIEIPVNLDGREVARITAPYTSRELYNIQNSRGRGRGGL